MERAYTMQEHEESMSVFYYKRTGVIYSWGTGIQSFNCFGQHSEDYKEILGLLILPRDNFVLDNMKLFKVDVENEALIYNEEFMTKYRMFK